MQIIIIIFSRKSRNTKPLLACLYWVGHELYQTQRARACILRSGHMKPKPNAPMPGYNRLGMSKHKPTRSRVLRVDVQTDDGVGNSASS